jgi:hypothetical protein
MFALNTMCSIVQPTKLGYIIANDPIVSDVDTTDKQLSTTCLMFAVLNVPFAIHNTV